MVGNHVEWQTHISHTVTVYYRLHFLVCPWRADRRDVPGCTVRSASDRYLFCSCTLSLYIGGGCGLSDLCCFLLLVSEDDRSNAQGTPRCVEFLADVPGFQFDLLPHAYQWFARNAAAGLHVLRWLRLGSMESSGNNWRGDP